MTPGVRFKPDDEDGFFAARRQLLDAYEAHLRAAGRPIDLFTAGLMLEYRFSYGDGRILTWGAPDIDGFLLDFVPNKTALAPEDLAAVPGEVRDVLTWLSGQGLLGGGPLERLLRQIEAVTPDFLGIARATSRAGFAARLVAAMQSEGVDPADQVALDRWMARFNARPIEERDRILGWEDGDDDPYDDEEDDLGSDPLPAVELAPEADLATVAAESVVLARLTTVTRFLAQRRKLTPKGNLTRADGRALAEQLGVGFEARYGDLAWPVRSSTQVRLLDRSFRWAKAAGFVKVRHGWASATAKGAALGKRPHEDWLAAFTAWVDGRVLEGVPTTWFDEPVLDLAEELPSILYRLGPTAIAALGEMAVELFDLDHGPDARTRGGDDPRPWVRKAVPPLVLEPLQELGVVSVVDGQVALTPLGRWGVNRWFRAGGVDAPVIGALAGATATALLEACADRSLEESEAEIERWIAARGDPAVAAEALGAVASGGGDLAIMAFHALGFVGSVAEPVVRGLVDSPVKGLALLWLAERGFEDPATMPTELLVAMLLQTFTLELDEEGAEALVAHLQELGPEEEQARWLESLERVDAPRVNDLLATVGRWHPSKVVAKAARTTLFKRKGLRLT